MPAVLVPVSCTARAVAREVVALFRTCVQVWPPSVDLLMPLLLIPANRTRLLTGDEVSSTRDWASPEPLVPSDQFCPPSIDRYRPLLADRYIRLLLAGSMRIV